MDFCSLCSNSEDDSKIEAVNIRGNIYPTNICEECKDTINDAF